MATKTIYQVHKAGASTTLNEIYPSQSFHLDETMVVGKVVSSSLIGGGPYRKRAAFTFPSYVKTTGYNGAYIKVYEAKASAMQKVGRLEIGFHSSSTGDQFVVGRGRRDSTPVVKEGSTWAFSSGNTPWVEATASVKVEYGFTGSTADIDANVSTLIQSVAGSNVFRFVHINYDPDYEDDSIIRGEIEYYSAETHTVYAPTLFVASESVALCESGKETGDFSLDTDYVLYHKNLRDTYQPDQTITFKFGARTLFPAATYGTASSELGNNYIPSTSTYNFKDVKSNELMLPSSMQETLAIESNASGHFIENVPTNLFYPYRKYQLVVNVKSGSSTDTVILPETFQVEA